MIVDYVPATSRSLPRRARASHRRRIVRNTASASRSTRRVSATRPLGGTLAAGWSGPRRHLYGRPRDYILGSTVGACRRHPRECGRNGRKNVTGYDMSRLSPGSFGTLGMMVQANLKTLASPRCSRVFSSPPARRHVRTRLRPCCRRCRFRPAGAVHVYGFHNAIDGEDGEEGRLAILLEGSSALLERATRDLRSAIGKAGVPETRIIDNGARESFERVIDAYIANLGERWVTYRFDRLVDQSNERATAAYNLAHRYELRSETILDIMNGDVILRVSDLDSRALGAKIDVFDEELHVIEPYTQAISSDHPHRTEFECLGTAPGIDRQDACAKDPIRPELHPKPRTLCRRHLSVSIRAAATKRVRQARRTIFSQKPWMAYSFESCEKTDE